MIRFTRLGWTILFLLGAVVLSGLATYFVSYSTERTLLSREGEIRLAQARERLIGQLSAYRQLPNILARHPFVIASAEGADAPVDMETFLLRNALTSGAELIVLYDRGGTILAQSEVGRVALEPGLLQAAYNGRLGFATQRDAETGKRFILISRGIRALDGGPVLGAVVVQIDIAALEFEWQVDEEAVAFVTDDGLVMISNRQSLQGRSIQHLDDGQDAGLGFLQQSVRHLGGEPDLPTRVMILKRQIPQVDLVEYVFMDAGPGRNAAFQQALLVGALAALVSAFILYLVSRRQQALKLLAVEEQLTQQLEARVDERTAQLRSAQEQLVTASKMTALGQLSAGISHELNQPLATVQNYAENGQKFLARENTDAASENFDLILGQVDRISRIIKSLRAFARKERTELGQVDLKHVLDDTLVLMETRMLQEGVTYQQTGNAALWVQGGQVRLQQVFVNLITNALDAMAGQKKKRLEITVHEDADDVLIRFRDTGTGISDVTRVFDPFYSTKEQGASKGLGLGLSISHGIIGSFGGELSCANHPDGGAAFTCRLKKTEAQT